MKGIADSLLLRLNAELSEIVSPLRHPLTRHCLRKILVKDGDSSSPRINLPG